MTIPLTEAQIRADERAKCAKLCLELMARHGTKTQEDLTFRTAYAIANNTILRGRVLSNREMLLNVAKFIGTDVENANQHMVAETK